MKIKSVCELTGLTDRTIRYYIEEKLISPLYTENYLGRKTYNFCFNFPFASSKASPTRTRVIADSTRSFFLFFIVYSSLPFYLL